MSETQSKEELYRRLAQARRLLSTAYDPLTKERLKDRASELERQIAAAESRDADAPPDAATD